MSTSSLSSAVMSAPSHLSAGDILVGTWGYEQTNASFYRVEKRTPKQVVLCRLKNVTTWTKDFNGEALPGDVRENKTERRKVTLCGNEEIVQGECFTLRKWDGKPVQVTSYA